MDVKPMYEPADAVRWTSGRWSVAPVEPLTGVSIDTRTVKPGDLFIAIRGEKADGHAFVREAISRGAAAVMVDDAACLQGFYAPALVVADTRKGLTDLARGYRRTLNCRMIAVTGSVGKTTVKELTADILNHVGITARTRGNWNNDLGLPLSILHARPDTAYGVFEVGMNHPGELDPLCDVLEPDVGVVTCVGPVHIEHFSGLPAIAMEKGAVYRGLKGQGVAVLNADDAHAELLRGQAGASRVVTVASGNGADYVYKRHDARNGYFTLREKSTGEVVDLHAALPGDYFVLDAALAAACARVLGAGWNAIRDAVRAYQPLSMRWNRHAHFGVHTVNDAYNANPVSLRAAVQAFLEEPVEGSRWLVFAGMLELGASEREIHAEAGAFIARYPGYKLLAVGPRGEWIAEGALAAGMPAGDVFKRPDAVSAAALLADALKSGDGVLFKASRGEAVEGVLKEWVRLQEVRHEGTNRQVVPEGREGHGRSA